MGLLRLTPDELRKLGHVQKTSVCKISHLAGSIRWGSGAMHDRLGLFLLHY